ncbi:MAG: hypothetical protein EA422_07965 [Gemmatimonadales bacterium]|nr:MAG: hypothetical protein EA422_07965 [Gemmatimonadales bacterium]
MATSSKSSGSSPSVLGFGLALAFFFIAGSAMSLIIWGTLSDFMAGRPVEGGLFLLALAVLGVFVGFAWLMARYLQSRVPWE